MELDLSNDGSRTTRRAGPWLEVSLITGFIFSLLIGIGAVAALLVSSQDVETWRTTSATQTIDPEQIVPQLALAQLSGDPAEALAYQAAGAGELDTASAIAVTATKMTGPQRLSLHLRLGERFQAAGRPDDAALHLNLARAVAVLDPSTGGVERSAALAQIAQGFLDANEPAAALDAALQSMRAAEQTPELLPALRSQAYEALRPVATALDDHAFTQELAELARNPYYEPPGVQLEARLPALRADPTFDEQVNSAIAQRQEAARQLADRIVLTNGLDIGPETQALAAALLQEDQLREAFYRRTLSEGLSLADQYGLLLDRRDWIALKLRVALQGFGFSIVPEWEQSVEFLRQELGTAGDNLNLVAEAMANELADPTDQAMLRTESLLWLAQQAELDLYAGVSVEDLGARLQNVYEELARLGSPLALPVVYEADADPAGFRFQSAR